MTRQNASRRTLVVLAVVFVIELAGAGQALGWATAQAQQPAVQQKSAKPPTVEDLPVGGIQSGQNESAPESTLQSGRLLKVFAPVYPPAAIQARISGVVVVDARVGTDGRVVAVNVVSGPLALRRVAEDAVKRWRYEPSFLNGRPVERDAEAHLRFKLDRY
jgi:TonB family protein